MNFLFICPLFFCRRTVQIYVLLGGIPQAETGGHCLGRGEFGTVIQMSINVCRGGEIAVAQPLLDLLHGNAVG